MLSARAAARGGAAAADSRPPGAPPGSAGVSGVLGTRGTVVLKLYIKLGTIVHCIWDSEQQLTTLQHWIEVYICVVSKSSETAASKFIKCGIVQVSCS